MIEDSDPCDDFPTAYDKHLDMWLQGESLPEESNTYLVTFIPDDEQSIYFECENTTSFVDLDKSTSLIDQHRRSTAIQRDGNETSAMFRQEPILNVFNTDSGDNNLSSLESMKIPEYEDLLSLDLFDGSSDSLLDVHMVPDHEKYTDSEFLSASQEEFQPIVNEGTAAVNNVHDAAGNLRQRKNSEIKNQKRKGESRIRKTSGRKPRNKKESGPKIWEFIIRLLQDDKHTHIITPMGSEGKFKYVCPDKFAELWAKRNGKSKVISYNNVARAMRYWYGTGYLEPVLGNHHIYRLGTRAIEYMKERYGNDHLAKWEQPDQWSPCSKFGDRDGDWRPCTKS